MTHAVRSTTYLDVADDCDVNVALRADDTIDAFFGGEQHAVILTFTPTGLRVFTEKLVRAGEHQRQKAAQRGAGC
jgi:hypothetical protein